VRNALLYPHPVRAETHFTYVLSQSAQVEIEVFSLAGKLVKRLGPYDQAAGFAQVAWDGRSSGGDLLANGTYLYRLVARNEAGGDAVFRGALVLAR
jgi:flagellar hook assembly protein FlgD